MASKRRTPEDMREELIRGVVEGVDGVAQFVESPIEALLYWAILLAFDDGIHSGVGSRWASADGLTLSGTLREEDAPDPDEWANGLWLVDTIGNEITLLVQPTVRVGDATYRLDFALVAARNHAVRRPDRIQVAIECDGHDFHEKTKEQARKDRKRDRNLQTHGWLVARFTGSEIFAAPVGCAEQLVQMVDKEQDRNDAEAKAAEIEARRRQAERKEGES